MIRLVEAYDQQSCEIVKDLFREYEAFLGVDLCFQGFAEELASLPGKYAPPDGAMLLAYVDDQPAGCVALKKIAPEVCEMKRLYVRPAFRKLGLGRKLAESIIQRAIDLGYPLMKLDTLATLEAAVALYKQLGFQETTPYYDNPLPQVIYMEKRLT